MWQPEKCEVRGISGLSCLHCSHLSTVIGVESTGFRRRPTSDDVMADQLLQKPQPQAEQHSECLACLWRRTLLVLLVPEMFGARKLTSLVMLLGIWAFL